MKAKTIETYKVKCCGLTHTLRRGETWRCPRCGKVYRFHK